MGPCFSKTKKDHRPNTKHSGASPVKATTPIVWHFKTQFSSRKLIVFDTQHSACWELELDLPYEFQQNQLVCRVSPDALLVVGGKDDGTAAMIIDLPSKTGRSVAAPPIPIEHGSLHLVGEACYAVGSITTSGDSEEPAPVLCFNLRHRTWSYLPPMPTQVFYPGSFVSTEGLHVLGGFIKSNGPPIISKSIQTYFFSSQHWAVSHFSAPLSTGCPMCVSLSGNRVLVVGGHDPSENVEETRDVFCFNWKDFTPLPSLPEVGSLCFKEPPLVTDNAVYAISEDEVLFTYSLQTATWASLDIEEKLHDDSVKSQPPAPKRTPGEYVYHYDPDGLLLTEHSIMKNVSRVTEPSSFQCFYKDVGMAMLSNGSLVFAGGRLQGEITKKVWVFDPVTRLSRNLPDLPCAQYGLRLVIKADLIYALVGCDDRTLNEEDSLNYCQLLTNEGWRELPCPLYQTKYPAAAAIGHKIYCIGGMTKMEFEVTMNLIQKFNTQTNVWKLLRVEYPLGVYCLGLVAMPSFQLFCFGGLFSSGHPVSECFLFDGKTFSEASQLVHGLTQMPEDTMFLDCPVVQGDSVYAFSVRGVLHKYSSDEWSVVHPKAFS
jgi:hypothetical protein